MTKSDRYVLANKIECLVDSDGEEQVREIRRIFYLFLDWLEEYEARLDNLENEETDASEI
ncbi:MAG: hypothetical protein CMI54_02415 [Parcubacteria group bacterium]|jgi:DNA-binding PadR family transcriptional regulator|nr:hypothetical protein [Parcubacteria group bacterium]|tara:strand:+ start:19134 stop:19313 length:180 start_codon:yes stop_codon:yes gene_type:complete